MRRYVRNWAFAASPLFRLIAAVPLSAERCCEMVRTSQIGGLRTGGLRESSYVKRTFSAVAFPEKWMRQAIAFRSCFAAPSVATAKKRLRQIQITKVTPKETGC